MIEFIEAVKGWALPFAALLWVLWFLVYIHRVVRDLRRKPTGVERPGPLVTFGETVSAREPYPSVSFGNAAWCHVCKVKVPTRARKGTDHRVYAVHTLPGSHLPCYMSSALVPPYVED